MEYRTKKDIATDIIERLLSEGMITLEYNNEDWEKGKEECAKLIVDSVLSYLAIADGRVIEDYESPGIRKSKAF